MKKGINFSIVKVQPRSVAQLFLIFFQFQLSAQASNFHILRLQNAGNLLNRYGEPILKTGSARKRFRKINDRFRNR